MRSYVLILFLLLCGFVFPSGSKETAPILSGDPGNSEKILILVEFSEYRFALAQSIKNNLSMNRDLFITIDDLGSYNGYSVDSFTALIILNAGKMANVDKRVKQIISLSEKKNIIVITTWGGKGSNPDIGVDSITAASSEKNIEDITNKVLTYLEKFYE